MANNSESIEINNKKYVAGVDKATGKDMTVIGEQAKKTGERISSMLLKIDIDVSDALKGLKAVQREAKKATQALKKFEEAKKL